MRPNNPSKQPKRASMDGIASRQYRTGSSQPNPQPPVQRRVSSVPPPPANTNGTLSQSSKSIVSPPAQNPRRRRLGLMLLLLPLLLIATAFILAVFWYKGQLKPLTSNDIYHVVSVKDGDSVATIAQQLEEKKVIKSATAFRWHVRFSNTQALQAGSYRLSSHLDVPEITTILREGKVTMVDILIPPGKRLDEITQILTDSGFEKSEIEDAYRAVRDHQLLANLPADRSLEGYIFPDTYRVGADTNAEQLLRLTLRTFESKYSQEIEAGLARHDLTFDQAVILASIVQMEESDPEVQKSIAQVFLKRLREGIPLGADPTFKYGAYLQGESESNASVNIDSPYNTRTHAGLPPTAIANFNLSALQAVANPAAGDYLFFVAGDDGVTHFSNSQAEHDALTRQHCQTCFH